MQSRTYSFSRPSARSWIAAAGLALTAFGLFAARPVAAQGLDGTSVTGSVAFGSNPNNYFDPANNFVPSGFSNTAGPTVNVTESAVEFGFQDRGNLDTADFRDGQLTLTDVSGNGGNAAHYTFTDAAFGGVTKLSDSFDGGLTYSLVGDTLTIDAQALDTPGTREAVFNLSGAPVPEASTTASFGLLLMLGLGGLIVAAKRKKAGVQA